MASSISPFKALSGLASVVALGSMAATLLLATPASATPNFPDVVAQHLNIGAPDCTLCHAGSPARGTVTTPFGNTIRSRGARAYDEGSIRTALDAIAAERKDSDGDGVPDIDELKSGENPNGGETVEYGCAAAPGARGSFTFLFGLVLAVCAIGRRFAFKEGASWRK